MPVDDIVRPYQLDRATVADIPSIVRVVNAAFEVETFIEGNRTDEAQVAQLLESGTFIVARQSSGDVVAAIYTEVRGDRGYFGMLAVDPACQGTGLGRAMVDAAEQQLREQGCCYVDITVLNLRPELLPFYRKLGYVESGTLPYQKPHLLKAGVECVQIVMAKPLKPTQ
jgi:ribosomal protein S18 acetylase RimI-like enzyme